MANFSIDFACFTAPDNQCKILIKISKIFILPSYCTLYARTIFFLRSGSMYFKKKKMVLSQKKIVFEGV